MAYTLYNSKIDGTPDQIIVSGDLDVALSSVTPAERAAGNTEFVKLWIESDIDVSTVLGLSSYTAYSHNVFLSASDSDIETDLTGAETRYGALKVVSATATSIIIEEDEHYTLVRVGDTIIVEEAPYEIATITDNGDSTLTIDATIDYVAVPAGGDFIASVFSLSLVATTPKSFWYERVIDAGSTWSGAPVVSNIIIGS